eukprot:354922-Chlamydomonas_euryale.AAC.1
MSRTSRFLPWLFEAVSLPRFLFRLSADVSAGIAVGVACRCSAFHAFAACFWGRSTCAACFWGRSTCAACFWGRLTCAACFWGS